MQEEHAEAVDAFKTRIDELFAGLTVHVLPQFDPQRFPDREPPPQLQRYRALVQEGLDIIQVRSSCSGVRQYSSTPSRECCAVSGRLSAIYYSMMTPCSVNDLVVLGVTVRACVHCVCGSPSLFLYASPS